MEEKEKIISCAIYTRKSTSEGLEKEFTTLDAQRESAENYIKSQKALGWQTLTEKYDDGGYTGADTNRPALQKLIEDIKIGKINCVVVYKVDRLSRSLLDFTRLLEFFDEYKVTFVSVTQHFNTDSSMGRLTLNILLSFAQFEREMISERTRDKIGAARKKGKWTGGMVPLGYDIDKTTHKLVINEQEAKIVKKIFNTYLEVKSILITTQLINEAGYTCKKFISENSSRIFGGKVFHKNKIHKIIMNPLYAGKVKYKGNAYPGEHKEIIDEATFQKVQDQIAYNRVDRKIKHNSKCYGLLSQLLRCKHCDCVMFHTYSSKNQLKQYRYYVCIKAQKLGYTVCPTRSVRAPEIENAVVASLSKIEINNNALLEEKYKRILPKLFAIWDNSSANEKRYLLKQLFTSIDYTVETGALGFNFNEKGVYELYRELCEEKKDANRS
jgi:site-specific DNA recombinase